MKSKDEQVSLADLNLDKKESGAKEEIDISEYEVASLEDLKLLRTSDKARKISIPFDEENKKMIIFYIKELTVNELLELEEVFFAFDKKGKAVMNWQKFYQMAFQKMVVKTEPKLRWRDLKFMNKKALNILTANLPNPFEISSQKPDSEEEKTRKK